MPRLRAVVLAIALGRWQDPNSVQLIWLPEGYDGIVRRRVDRHVGANRVGVCRACIVLCG